MKKSRLRQVRIAYDDVFGQGSSEALSDNQIVDILTEVITHMEKYPFETDEQYNQRLIQISDVNDRNQILTYTTSINFPEKTTNMLSEECLFTVYKYYLKGDTQTETPQASKPVVEEPTQIEDIQPAVNNSEPVVKDKAEESNVADSKLGEDPQVESKTKGGTDIINNKKYSNEKQGGIQMSGLSATDALNALQNQANNAGAGVDSNLTDAYSQSDLEAVQASVEAELETRIDFSRRAKVVTFVTTGFGKSKVAIDGANAMGTVINPEKQLKNFINKFGVKEDETGNVVFDKAYEGEDLNKVKEIYETLKAAVKDPNHKVKPKFNDIEKTYIPSIRGFVIQEPDGKETTVRFKEMHGFLVNNTIGAVNTTAEGGQVKIRNLTGGKNKAKQVPGISIPEMAKLVVDENFAKTYRQLTDKPLTPDSKERPVIFTSELSAAYKGKQIEETGKFRKSTFAIRLDVPQFEQIPVQAFVDTLGDISRAVTKTDINDEAAVDSMAKELVKNLAFISTQDAGKLSSTFRTKLSETKSKMKAKKEEEVKEMVQGPGADPEDFE